jgi:hypothetical protein
MTPKEKAIDLIKQFPNNGHDRKCAYICVDEILLEIDKTTELGTKRYNFWKLVKIELKLL